MADDDPEMYTLYLFLKPGPVQLCNSLYKNILITFMPSFYLKYVLTFIKFVIKGI